MVIMNQEVKNVNRNTCEDNDNVNHVTLVTALGGAWLYKFTMLGKAGVTDPFKTCTVVVRLGMDMIKVKKLSVRQKCHRKLYLQTLNSSWRV